MVRKYGKIDDALFRQDPNTGSMVLDLPPLDYDLPPVSIVTITKDRSLFAPVMLHNWNTCVYPPEKLEWVIVDDSQDPKENLEQYIPSDDKRINYIKLKEWMPIADKRNFAVSKAKYDIIAFQDDDDFYFPDSVYAKVRILNHYKKEVVTSIPIGVYDMVEKTSFILDTTVKNGKRANDIPEATLLFKKSYWKNNKFKSEYESGASEGKAFLNKKFNAWINVHFLFNTISITHTKNITNNNRRLYAPDTNEPGPQGVDLKKVGDFKQVFGEGFNYILDNISTFMKTN